MCLYTLISSTWAFSSLGKMTSDVYLCMPHVPVLSSSSCPFTGLTPLCLYLFCWGAQNLNQHSTWVSPGWEEGKDCLLCPDKSAVYLVSPRCNCPSWAAEAQHWLIFSLFTGFLRSFSEKLLWCFSWLSPSIYLSREFFLPRCRTWHLPLLNYIKFLFILCSSLLRSLWAAAQASGLSSSLPNFVIEQIDYTDPSLKNSR